MGAFASLAGAQSNTIPGADAALKNLREIAALGREGTYPNGRNGLAPETVVCNLGMCPLPWQPAMSEDHPVFATLIAAERNGRVVQISDHSYLKHGYQAENGNLCGSCTVASQALGPGCSDVYSTMVNGNNYWLGPPEEVDPWLGTWTADCSLFDRGEPPVAPPNDCDGLRSFTIVQANNLGPVGHRVAVDDADLIPSGKYFVQVFFLMAGEAEGLRADNLGYRRFLPTWKASINTWNTIAVNSFKQGSVLGAWSGASLSSAVDGAVDGRVFVASRATPVGCAHHYEYAIHNRDNGGGVEAVRIPLAPGATVSAAGFRDVDGSAANDWSVTVTAGEIVFAGPSNPVAWNTIYNVWFDADVAPATGAVALELVTGSPDLAVAGLDLPLGSASSFTCATYCTAGVSAAGCQATISASGAPSATAPSGFFLGASDVEGQREGMFFFGTGPRIANPWGNGTALRCVASPVTRGALLLGTGSQGTCDALLTYDLNARWTARPLQNPGAGATVRSQLWYRDPDATSSPLTNLSDAVEFVVGP